VFDNVTAPALSGGAELDSRFNLMALRKKIVKLIHAWSTHRTARP
jgi:hypothetical protein